MKVMLHFLIALLAISIVVTESRPNSYYARWLKKICDHYCKIEYNHLAGPPCGERTHLDHHLCKLCRHDYRCDVISYL